jgi:hypothetical protein
MMFVIQKISNPCGVSLTRSTTATLPQLSIETTRVVEPLLMFFVVLLSLFGLLTKLLRREGGDSLFHI